MEIFPDPNWADARNVLESWQMLIIPGQPNCQADIVATWKCSRTVNQIRYIALHDAQYGKFRRGLQGDGRVFPPMFGSFGLVLCHNRLAFAQPRFYTN